MKRILMAAVLIGVGGSAYAADFSDLAGVGAAGIKALASAESITVPEVDKGYWEPLEPAAPVEWVTIPGGKFRMGTTSIEQGFGNAKPVREVTIKTFQMAKTDVTVAQYAECLLRGGCTKPGTGKYCNWGEPGRENHPVNCVDWRQAQQYAKFKGARLPSESEWEYAATSGGRNQKYPWGNQEPARELVVFNTNSTMPVCSKPMGNTAQGLCDMGGNVWQWVQDKYRNSYAEVPADGSAFEGTGRGDRVLRGGSFRDSDVRSLRADFRISASPMLPPRFTFGFRLAR